jgi:tetratricopeptide (TPR) repeat protein
MISILRPKAAFAFAILAVLGLLIYANAVGHPFVHDDVVFILQNPNIARWDNIGQAFLDAGVPFQGLKITTPYYRPVLEIIYRSQFAIFGMNAWGFHLVNVLLHIVNSWLVFWMVRLLLLEGRRKAEGGRKEREPSSFRSPKYFAFFISILFLVHPLQSEAVACVSGISNLAVAFFLLGAFIQYADSRLARGRARMTALLLAGLSFTVALFTKEQAVIFPLFLAAYELAGRRRGDRTAQSAFVRSAAALAPFFVLAAGYLLWRSHLFPDHFAAAFANPAEFWLRISVIPRTILMYFGLVLWPAGLHYYRSVDIFAPVGWAWPVLAALMVVVIFRLGRMSRSCRVPALFGLLWGGLFLLPGLNIVPLINEYSLVLASEHFLYLSLAGFLVALAGLVFGALARCPARVSGTVMVVVIGVFCVLTIRQNTTWRGEVPLFERTLAFEPGLGRVHFLLAKAYVDERRLADAFDEYTRGLRIMEDYVKKSRLSQKRGARGAASAVVVYQQYVKAAHHDRGQVLLMTGDLKRSSDEFRAALATAVDGVPSTEVRLTDSRTANNLALNLLRMGRPDEARRWWQTSVRIAPESVDAINNLGMLAFQRGDKVAARFFFRKALKLAPGFIPARQNLERLGK